jgi:mono/diheme cytochrome c family protein
MSSDPSPPTPGKPGASGDPGDNRSNFEGREDRLAVSAAHAAIMREKAEPREGREPTPLWLVGLFGVLLFWGGIYVQRYSGGYDALEFDELAVAGAPRAEQGDEAPVDPLVLGRRVYVNNCQVCHQADGEGLTGQYPPVAASEWVLADNPERLVRILLDGVSGPMNVRGRQYNNVMPAWHDVLNDRQIAAVLTYIRQEWGNTADAVEVDEVQSVREATQTRRGRMWTEAELLAIPIEE